MTKISPADEGIEAARRDASSSCAESSLLEVGAKAETLSRLITREINSRMNEAHGAVRINWAHVGTMNYTHEKLVLVAEALGITEAARRDAFERESTTFMRCYNCSREYRTDEMIHDCDESYFCRPCHAALLEEEATAS